MTVTKVSENKVKPYMLRPIHTLFLFKNEESSIKTHFCPQADGAFFLTLGKIKNLTVVNYLFCIKRCTDNTKTAPKRDKSGVMTRSAVGKVAKGSCLPSPVSIYIE